MFDSLIEFAIMMIIPAILVGSFLVNHKTPSGKGREAGSSESMASGSTTSKSENSQKQDKPNAGDDAR